VILLAVVEGAEEALANSLISASLGPAPAATGCDAICGLPLGHAFENSVFDFSIFDVFITMRLVFNRIDATARFEVCSSFSHPSAHLQHVVQALAFRRQSIEFSSWLRYVLP
jgi:hypothetical protein